MSGVHYTDPTNPDRHVRTSRASTNPEAPPPGQQSDNVKAHNKGSFRDAVGAKIGLKTYESHIDVKDFNFDRIFENEQS